MHGKDQPVQPTLIIVMGTSGSGKSTLGASLAKALNVAFVDGDDLHPKANVDKMAQGIPLNDADRLPWLLSIRQKALELCRSGDEAVGFDVKQDQHDVHPEKVRQFAETYETSEQPRDADGIFQEANKAKIAVASKNEQSHITSSTSNQQMQLERHACVIACSALKRSYRHLLRYGLDATDAEIPEGERKVAQTRAENRENANIFSPHLNVYHVYVRITPEHLLQRMHDRKGHFMKESMLKSQLDTLEEPIGEENVLILDDADNATLTEQAKKYFIERLT